MSGIKTKALKWMFVSSLTLCGVDIGSTGYVAGRDYVFTQIGNQWRASFDAFARWRGYAPKAPPLTQKSAKQLVISEAVANGVNPDLLLAQWQVESRGDGFAVSPAGAIGHMQIMPVNAVKLCGYQHSAELYDEKKNIRCGVKFMSQLLRDYKWDVAQALRAYNGGPKCAGGGCRESDRYVGLVMSALAKNVEGEA